MAIGDSSELGYRSIAATRMETAYGTIAGTATNFFEFISNGLKGNVEELKGAEINSHRGYTRRFQMNRTVEGSVEKYLHPVDGIDLFLHALGGTISTTALSTGAYSHVIKSGDLNPAASTTYSSFTMDVRKGPNRQLTYSGLRVNQMSIKGEIGQPIMVTYDLVGKDFTATSATTDGAVSFSTVRPFLFTDGKFQYASTSVLADTTTAAERVIGFELTINNNLISDANARAIGTNTLMTLPAGRRDVSLKLTMRVDTSTVYDRMVSGSQGGVILQMTTNQSIAAQTAVYDMKIDLPRVFYNAGDIEVSEDVLTVEPEITALRGDTTTANYDISATLQNGTASY